MYISVSRSQLLLWPTFKLSAFSRASSPLLRDLLFTSQTNTGYAHITHRIYPLQTFPQTSDELIKISSTVSDRREDDDKMATTTEEVRSSPEAVALVDGVGGRRRRSISVETSPCHEHMYWTDLPSFLIAYSPKVSRKAETVGVGLEVSTSFPA